MRTCSPYTRLSVNSQYKGWVPDWIASSIHKTINPGEEQQKSAGVGEMNKARPRVRGRKRDSPIHSTPRWAIFLFFPFSQSTHWTKSSKCWWEQPTRLCCFCFPVWREGRYPVGFRWSGFQWICSILSCHYCRVLRWRWTLFSINMIWLDLQK